MRIAAFLAAVIGLSPPVLADEVIISHGLSAFGDLKYSADFEHFEYADPEAPKGGRIVTVPALALQTFDSLNPFILKGDAAEGMASQYNWVFDRLMVASYDEPAALYGLVAKHAEHPPTRDWVIFEMRPEAEFADGTPITAADVVASFDLIKTESHPLFRSSVRDIEMAEALGTHRVKFTFAAEAAKRDLPLIAAGLPIFSAAYWADRDFSESSMDVPLSSGPYRVKQAIPKTKITYERRDDYWGRDLPVNVGRYNFDEIVYEYFPDQQASLQALAAGAVTFREEFSSKSWGTQYDFPAIESGEVKRDKLPDTTPSGSQGYMFNTRREKFQDPRVREALALAFDFEWSNQNLFYGLYQRTFSFFQNSGMEAKGAPSEAELALLEPLRDQLPEAVFGEAYVPPKTDGSGNLRRQLRTASKLLDEAGWTLKDGVRINADGEPLQIEFLDRSSAFERITNPYIRNLEKLGVQATFRMVDRAQYQRRFEEFDFDIVTIRFPIASTPGVELRNMFHSESADNAGSYNPAGINDPAIDVLVDAVVAATNRQELAVAVSALDRALRAGFYWVPQWNKPFHSVAYWDIFGRPEATGGGNRGVIDLWWADPAKAALAEDIRGR